MVITMQDYKEIRRRFLLAKTSDMSQKSWGFPGIQSKNTVKGRLSAGNTTLDRESTVLT